MEPRKESVFQAFIGLFMPRRCAGCDQGLMSFERSLCTACITDLPRTRAHDDATNKVERIFHGRVELEAAASFLQFDRGGKVQHMLHRLKYRGDAEVGLELGRRMAEDAMRSVRFAGVDTALAVPLHRSKERQRGYNQSQLLVDGMREVWPLKDLGKGLLRSQRITSQTKRGRADRWTNVKEAFEVHDDGRLHGAHVLLVDDVVTTGATLEGCARALQRVPGVRVSVLTCACA